jgi:Tfp pilus assembly protein PilV
MSFTQLRQRRDDGFGLTEVMISMLLLVILFLAMISLLITALQVVGKNSTRASAGQLATQRMEELRVIAVQGDCDALVAAAEAVLDTEDGRGTPLSVAAEVETCVQDFEYEPTLARVAVTVTTTDVEFDGTVSTVVSDIFVSRD